MSDVDDARRVAQQLGIDHFVFNLSDDFDEKVVAPYVDSHVQGETPNPCIECNRHLKFDRLLNRAEQLGFDALVTGHHARVVEGADGRRALARGADPAKDQSYVLHMLTSEQLARCRFPIGEIDKVEVRRRASALGLRTATKPESQDVCFIASATGGRRRFLEQRIALRPARVVDRDGVELARTDAVELITIGQRKGLGLPGGGPVRFAIAVDAEAGRVVVGSEADLLCDAQLVSSTTWCRGTPPPAGSPAIAQCSAHGSPREAVVEMVDPAVVRLRWREPQRRVAPGQSIVLYDGDVVLGGGRALAPSPTS